MAAKKTKKSDEAGTTGDWTPSSWQDKPVKQLPTYADPEALDEVLKRLAKLPPLVTSWEIETLKSQLAEAAEGKRFLLQGGDCSENFAECESSIIADKLKILLQMSLVLIHGSRRRVIRVGRFAGQYAKPRSSDVEKREGVELPSYRGDLVNALEFDAEKRIPDPERLLIGYSRAALTINFIRSLIDGGFADLHHPEYWDLEFIKRSPQAKEYDALADSISTSLEFMESVTGVKLADLHRAEFFTSHEGLHLHYEQAQTRSVPRRSGCYNLATHFPWIGDRTRDLNGAHVEYFRGIENPIGVKVGPSIEPAELVRLVRVLNPKNEPGKLTLIHRFGAPKIAECLPPLIDAIAQSGDVVVWCCDPMHGNAESTATGLKTRSFDKILDELKQAFDIHTEKGSDLGGVHFELTGESVTECVGGSSGPKEADLSQAYKTQVDPRLNGQQALEMAFLISRHMQRGG